jgi:hypothetical protein
LRLRLRLRFGIRNQGERKEIRTVTELHRGDTEVHREMVLAPPWGGWGVKIQNEKIISQYDKYP